MHDPTPKSAASGTPSRLLSAELLDRTQHLALAAEKIVEGAMAGSHRSPYRGFSIEFAQHREYAPGDDLRHLDWKRLARTERYAIKQYDVETNLTAHLVLDASASMGYRSQEVPLSKLDYACFVAASLSYLIVRQSDAVGLTVFERTISRFLEPRQTLAQVKHICEQLESLQPEGPTQTGKSLLGLADRLRRRSIVILIADLLDDVPELLAGLNRLHFAKHEVIVLQILDPAELTFPFEGQIRFAGLEHSVEIPCQPRMLRKAYIEAMQQHISSIKLACDRNRMDYALMDTAQPLEVALFRFLQSRNLRR